MLLCESQRESAAELCVPNVPASSQHGLPQNESKSSWPTTEVAKQSHIRVRDQSHNVSLAVVQPDFRSFNRVKHPGIHHELSHLLEHVTASRLLDVASNLLPPRAPCTTDRKKDSTHACKLAMLASNATELVRNSSTHLNLKVPLSRIAEARATEKQSTRTHGSFRSCGSPTNLRSAVASATAGLTAATRRKTHCFPGVA